MHTDYETLLKTLTFPPVQYFWALDPGFQGNAQREEKARIIAFFLSRSTLSHFSHSFFLALPRSFLFALASAKVRKEHGRPPLSTT
jgi:hypothetical protein